MSSFNVNLLSATIASGTAYSNLVDVGGNAFAGIYAPAGTAITSLSFQASYDGSTFFDVYDDQGTEYTATVAASHFTAIDFNTFLGVRYMKLRAGTGGSPSSQTSQSIFKVALREV